MSADKGAALISRAALDWITSDDTGLSSQAIWTHMTGGANWPWGYPHYPHDPSDLGRCLRLLEAVPEWKPRIAEMAERGPEWAALVARWDELAASYALEEPTRRAPITYAAMRAAIDEAGAHS